MTTLSLIVITMEVILDAGEAIPTSDFCPPRSLYAFRILTSPPGERWKGI